MELVQGAHPLAVALGQVVVHCDHVHSLAAQGVEEHGKGRYQGLALACGHLGYLALMQHRAADELHVVMHHIPGSGVAARHPGVLPLGIVALYRHIVVRGAQVAVLFCGLHPYH